MNKIIYDVLIVGGVVLAYVFMAAFQGGTNEIIASANASISSNYTGIIGMEAAMNSFPIYQWFIPGLVGIVAFVANHKMH